MWLHVPGISCRSATATAEQSSHSDPWHQYEPWLVLSGTATQRPFSWNGWARRAWIRALSGMTLPPSTVDRGVDAWISSLPVSPAPISHRRGVGPELTVSTGSGPSASRSSARWDRLSSCWKTSPDLFGSEDLPESSVILPTSGSMRNGVCSERPTLVPLTNVTAGGLWPTARAHDGASGVTAHSSPDFRPTLKQAATTMWPTPVAADCKGDGPSNRDRAIPPLRSMVSLWSTPRATQIPESVESYEARMRRSTTANRVRKDGGVPKPPLDVQVKMWGTPRAVDAFKGTDPTHGNGGQTGLKQQLASRLAATTTTDGEIGSPRADLNPFFVAALMGLPWDWLTHSTSEVTASCRNALHTPGDNYSTVAGG